MLLFQLFQLLGVERLWEICEWLLFQAAQRAESESQVKADSTYHLQQ